MRFAAAAAFAFASPASATPLVANGGFETGALTPWVNGLDASDPFFASAPWQVTSIDARSGRFSAETLGNREIRQDIAPILARHVAELSFWLRHPNAEGAPASVSFLYDDGTEGAGVALTNGSAWQRFDLVASLDRSKRLTGIGVFGYGPGDDSVTRLDDVTIRAPAPGAMALFGLAGFFLARRRVRR